MTETNDFAIALRGYDRQQVDAYVARVHHLFEEADLRGRGDGAAGNADERLGGRLAAILKLAEEEAGARRAAAQREAAAILDRANRDVERRAEAIVAAAEAEALRILEVAERRRREQEAATAAAKRHYDEVQEAVSRLRATLVPEVTDIRRARGAA